MTRFPSESDEDAERRPTEAAIDDDPEDPVDAPRRDPGSRRRGLALVVGAITTVALVALFFGGDQRPTPPEVEVAMPAPATATASSRSTPVGAAPAPAAAGRSEEPAPAPAKEDIATPAAAPAAGNETKPHEPPVPPQPHLPDRMAAAIDGTTQDAGSPAAETPGNEAFVGRPGSGIPVVVTRGSWLRAEASAEAAVIGHVRRGERLVRLGDTPVAGYYPVMHQTLQGWVWWRNVSEAVPPEQAPPGERTPADSPAVPASPGDAPADPAVGPAVR
jgi:hypothetical protein